MFKKIYFLLALALVFSNAHAGNLVGAKPKLVLPEFNSGKMFSLKRLKGRVVYIDFWASWCGPCRKSLPEFNKLYKQYKNKGFSILAINLDDDKAAARKFLKQFPVDYTVLTDAKNLSPKGFKVQVMPTGFLLDRKGIIRHVHKGFRNGDEQKLKHEVLKLLAR